MYLAVVMDLYSAHRRLVDESAQQIIDRSPHQGNITKVLAFRNDFHVSYVATCNGTLRKRTYSLWTFALGSRAGLAPHPARRNALIKAYAEKRNHKLLESA